MRTRRARSRAAPPRLSTEPSQISSCLALRAAGRRVGKKEEGAERERGAMSRARGGPCSELEAPPESWLPNLADPTSRNLSSLHHSKVLLLLQCPSSNLVPGSLVALAPFGFDPRDPRLPKLFHLLAALVHLVIGCVEREAVVKHKLHVGVKRFDRRVDVLLEVGLDRAEVPLVAARDDVVIRGDVLNDLINLRGRPRKTS